MGNYFGAGVTGLNFNENLYKVKFKPGSGAGDSARFLGTDPMVPRLSFNNYVTTGERGSGDQVVIYGAPFNNKVVLRGTVPAGFATFSVKGSLPNPAGYAASVLKRTLMSSSVGFADTISVMSGGIETRKVLDEYQSPSLKELCQQTNWWSIICTLILFQVDWQKTGWEIGLRKCF